MGVLFPDSAAVEIGSLAGGSGRAGDRFWQSQNGGPEWQTRGAGLANLRWGRDRVLSPTRRSLDRYRQELVQGESLLGLLDGPCEVRKGLTGDGFVLADLPEVAIGPLDAEADGTVLQAAIGL